MSQFINITRYEYTMSTRRPGFWIAYTLLALFYFVTLLSPSANPADDIIPPDKIWSEAGHIVFLFNIFMPLLAGILSADRMQRDFSTGPRELQRSAPLSIRVYILAKYTGVLLSVLTPIFLVSLIAGGMLVLRGQAPITFLGTLLLAFLSIAVPGHAFVVAFSLACPLVLPLRVYQVLFTGYWFWGNLISPKAFPTISDTLLNAVGQFPLQAFFGIYTDSTHAVTGGFTRVEAVLNLIVLLACITAALSAAGYFLRRQDRHS
jgi:ABC-type transport system involved in multi-copper enzyme maturation permease subunit